MLSVQWAGDECARWWQETEIETVRGRAETWSCGDSISWIDSYIDTQAWWRSLSWEHFIWEMQGFVCRCVDAEKLLKNIHLHKHPPWLCLHEEEGGFSLTLQDNTDHDISFNTKKWANPPRLFFLTSYFLKCVQLSWCKSRISKSVYLICNEQEPPPRQVCPTGTFAQAAHFGCSWKLRVQVDRWSVMVWKFFFKFSNSFLGAEELINFMTQQQKLTEKKPNGTQRSATCGKGWTVPLN